MSTSAYSTVPASALDDGQSPLGEANGLSSPMNNDAVQLLERDAHLLGDEEDEEVITVVQPMTGNASPNKPTKPFKQQTQRDGVFANMSAKPERIPTATPEATPGVASSSASISGDLPPDYTITMLESIPPPVYGTSGYTGSYPGGYPTWPHHLNASAPSQQSRSALHRIFFFVPASWWQRSAATDGTEGTDNATGHNQTPSIHQHLIDYEVDASGMTHVLIDGLAIGSLFTFFITMFCSLSFQFVGFMLTYIMSVSHAGRKGAKAGLGLTMLQYGFYLRARILQATDPNAPYTDDSLADDLPRNATPQQFAQLAVRAEWISYTLMLLGWFILIHSTVNYIKIKRIAAAAMAALSNQYQDGVHDYAPPGLAATMHVV